MAKAKSIGWRELVKAGFTVINGWQKRFYKVIAPNGDRGVVLRQSKNKWHFFWDAFEGSASGHTPETCQKGGLGDVIGTDGELRSYENMLLGCPEAASRGSNGLYRCSSDVFNSVTPERRRKYAGA